ncbi:MAG: hypothetical protein Q9180_003826 [Flavoplaca navasiana]
MKAVIIKEQGVAELADIDEQSMRPKYIKVKTVAVALNPTDFHHTDGEGPLGSILGCDLSGIVEEVGNECSSDVKKGDKVFAVCHCGNHVRHLCHPIGPSTSRLIGDSQQQLEDGAYAEYAMVKDGHLAKIPNGLGFEETASMGAGVTTVGQALYHNLKLPWPTEPAKTAFPILIYGGSTATGALAIQYAKLSGLMVITTASPKNYSLVKSCGADAVFDYHDPDCGSKIRAFTNNNLRHVFDCISIESSYRIDAAALSSDSTQELHCLALLPTDSWPAERQDVNVRWMLAYTSFGEEFFKFGATYPANAEHYDMGVRFWKLNARFLEEGKVKTHPVTVKDGGLLKLPEG